MNQRIIEEAMIQSSRATVDVTKTIRACSIPPRPVLAVALGAALEKATADERAHEEFESECLGYCGAPGTVNVRSTADVHRLLTPRSPS